MNKAGFPKKPHNSYPLSGDDIPVALRDTNDAGSKIKVQPVVLIIGGLTGFLLLAVSSGFLFSLTTPKPTANSVAAPISSTPIAANTPNNNDTVLGHFPYSEAPESELAPITGDSRIRMRKAAAVKFQAMVQTARSAGVILVPISGFRSVQEQKQLFFGVGAQRNQTPAERASLSAPPNHSEHHTGYAVDVGDGTVPATNLQANFDNTKAYQWLQANAAKFSFEISFPKNNLQGVSYEPWHWRFVGDTDSLETFYKAKNIKPVKTP
ncbi:D-alanyl-D-alanine carboxypeptidase family protein [Dolichospermum lemmermannii CS-548]|uniref:M15 family metallopeptidase n=1 Tax=Dolichospermum lemmermannii TaxID=54295 RepID=UPI00232C658D|nr:M15 family metallopeptidase [Dolichospermum lemmermannii]MDB9436355.1 D-alanyl-D-alanine carboxypeptidase family protein [Dolichospermum lemmermannii CS-548]